MSTATIHEVDGFKNSPISWDVRPSLLPREVPRLFINHPRMPKPAPSGNEHCRKGRKRMTWAGKDGPLFRKAKPWITKNT